MIDKFIKLLRNKIFLISLCIINAIIFIFGFIINDFELMFIAVLSYASVLIGIEANKGYYNNNKDERKP